MTRRKKGDDESRFEKTRRVWTEITQRVMDLRAKDREFHGLQGELRAINVVLQERFAKSKDIAHPRDIGNEREEIIKSFLSESGLLPRKYGISRCSTRAVGRNGHISKEMDILIYNYRDNVVVKKYKNVLEFYPADTVYGAISIKSRANKKEIREGLENIASFKAIYPGRESELGRTGSRGFGVLMAYTSDLSGSDLYDEIKSFSDTHDVRLLPNTIVILDTGSFVFGNDTAGYLLNQKLDGTDGSRLYPRSDIMGDGLYYFYEALMALLQERKTTEFEPSKYFDLPVFIDGFSYSFDLGAASEEAKCDKHGPYLRRMKAGRIAKIVDFMNTHEQIEWLRAIDLGRGEPGTNEAAYKRQPGWIYLYNPDNFPLDRIIFSKEGFNAYDPLIIEERHVWVPLVYCIKEDLYHGCPVCEAAEVKKISRRNRKTPPGEPGGA